MPAKYFSSIVTMNVPNGKRVTTNELGEFEILEPRPNSSRDGIHICFAYDEFKVLGRCFYWEKSEDMDDLEIVLESMVSVFGRVVDPNGQGVACEYTEISIGKPDGRWYRGREFGYFRTTVELDGSFEFEQVPVGLP